MTWIKEEIDFPITQEMIDNLKSGKKPQEKFLKQDSTQQKNTSQASRNNHKQ